VLKKTGGRGGVQGPGSPAARGKKSEPDLGRADSERYWKREPWGKRTRCHLLAATGKHRVSWASKSSYRLKMGGERNATTQGVEKRDSLGGSRNQFATLSRKTSWGKRGGPQVRLWVKGLTWKRERVIHEGMSGSQKRKGKLSKKEGGDKRAFRMCGWKEQDRTKGTVQPIEQANMLATRGGKGTL